MKIINLSINRPITVLMVYMLILITGVISFLRLPIDFLPNIGYPQLTVITTYDNSSPEEVETLITQPVEEVVSTLKGVRKVTSVSREDVSVVTIKYNWGTEMSFASLDLREKLDNIRHSLPEDAERPNIARLDPSEEPVMYISLTSRDTESVIEIQHIAENLIKRRLQQLEGIAAAELIGDREEEIEILLDEDKINAMGLDLNDLETRIQYSNYNIPGGTIKEGHYRYNIKIVGEFRDLKDIGKTPVAYGAKGNVILLSDIAEINSGYKDEKTITRLNSSRSLGLLVRKEANANTVKVCKTVRESLEQLRNDYPEIGFKVAVDQSVFINESIRSVLEAILLGGFLAFLVLFFFLSDLKSPFHISLVIPSAILTTFILMFFNKISLNIISLSGLALGVGMLVDNSIVVSENIFRHKAEGKGWKEASLSGAKEVGMAITASTLTTLAVFLPILYVKGIAASLFKQQALTVTFALISSLFVSVTMLPLLASLREARAPKKAKPKKQHKKFVRILIAIGKGIIFPFKMIIKLVKLITMLIGNLLGKLFGGIIRRFHKIYDKFALRYETLLEKALVNRGKVLLIFLVLFIAAISFLGLLDREFFPEFEQSNFTILMKLEPGSPLNQTDDIIKIVEQRLADDERIDTYFTSVGKSTEDMLSYYLEDSSNDNLAELKINLNAGIKAGEVIADYAEFMKQFPAATSFKKGDNILVSLLEFEEPGLSVVVMGDDLDLMKARAKLILDQVRANPVFNNIRNDFETEAPMITMQVNREAASVYNIPVNQIAKFVRTNISGDKISDFQRFDDKIDITLKLQNETDLTNLMDRQMNWGEKRIPLRALVTTKHVKSFEEIKRADQTRRFTISTAYTGKMDEALGELDKIVSQHSEEKVHFSVEGVNKEINGSLKSLLYALIFAIVLVYMILASQFESLKLPFIVMFVTPMGIIGVVFALILSGTAISIMSTLGMIVLSGIIVNDAILLVDYINQLRKKGETVHNSVMKAAKTRLRPILMTTFTTVLGLLPLAIGLGSGAELQSAMAVAVIGGMLTATFLTLIFIPILYSVFERE